MNLFRTLSGLALLCLAGAGLSSCLNAPNYPVEPSIDFNSLQLVRNRPAGVTEIDTLKFALDFRDGDGDLGLSDADILVAPWNATTGGHNNRGYAYNYFIQPYRWDGTTWVKFVIGFQGEYDGRFFRLDAKDARPSPLKGVLRYSLPLNVDGAPFYPGDRLRFEVSILDRALHQSNVITTSEVTLGR